MFSSKLFCNQISVNGSEVQNQYETSVVDFSRYHYVTWNSVIIRDDYQSAFSRLGDQGEKRGEEQRPGSLPGEK